MNNQFEKVKLTYKILMELMGLSEVYDRIMEDYNLKRNYQLKHISWLKVISYPIITFMVGFIQKDLFGKIS